MASPKSLVNPIPDPELPNPGDKEVALWDEDNPLSLSKLVPPVFCDEMKKLPLEMLVTTTKKHRSMFKITHLEEEMRQAFWDEYFIACDNQRKMRMEAVYGRLMSRENFYKYFMRTPERLSFILKPPANYMYRMRCILEMGIERFYEILKLPLTAKHETRNGRTYTRVNTQLIAEVIKIVALVDNRVKGAVPQQLKVMQENRNLNVNMDYEPPKSVKEIENELKEVQQEINQLVAGGMTLPLTGNNVGDYVGVERSSGIKEARACAAKGEEEAGD